MFTFMPIHSSIGASLLQQQQECVLAIDVGTGGTKSCIVSSLGKVIISSFSPHPPPLQSRIGGSLSMEQDQEKWWTATVRAIQKCVLSPACDLDLSCIRGIAVTGQMQDIIMLPKAGSALRTNAILYCDTRAGLEMQEIADMVGGSAKLTATTGSMQGASSVLGKLRWIDKYMETAAASCESILFGGHDYVVWRLCGSRVTDVTTASTTGLTNSSFQYAHELIEKAGLQHWISKLPEIFPGDLPCGEVTSLASNELGCPSLQGLPVIHCCGDAGACTLGAGAASPGFCYAYLGTSGWVAGTFPSHRTDGCSPGVFTLGHPDPSLVFKTGSIMTAGGNLSWAKTKLTLSSSYDEINKLACSASVGSGGLLYLPFLNGERCPVDNPNYRAAFIGISERTDQADMLRAVMEGVAFAMRSAHEAMSNQELDKDTPLRLVGGGARSNLWPLIMAGVFGRTVEVLSDAQDVGVKGAAILAGKWLGWHSDLSPGAKWIDVETTYEPSPEDIITYKEFYMTYLEACKSMQHVFDLLSFLNC